MPVLGFPLRDVAYCIIMTDSEMVPITDKTILVLLMVSSSSMPPFSALTAASHLGALETVQRQQSQRICSFSKLPR